MANDFKRFAVTNVNTSTGASATSVYSVPAGAGSTALESIVIGITISNTTTTGITASVFLDNNSGSNDVHIVKNHISTLILDNCFFENRLVHIF